MAGLFATFQDYQNRFDSVNLVATSKLDFLSLSERLARGKLVDRTVNLTPCISSFQTLSKLLQFCNSHSLAAIAIVSRPLIDSFSFTKLRCGLQLATSSYRSHAAVAGRLVSLMKTIRCAARNLAGLEDLQKSIL